MGRAMAREIARKKCNLLLVSTSFIDLQRFAIGLQLKEDVMVEAVRLDLADQKATQDFSLRIKENYEIRVLINNITCDWSLKENRCIADLSGIDFLSRFRGAAQLTMDLLPQLSTQPYAYIQHIIPFPFRKEHFEPEMQESVAKMYAFTRKLKFKLRHTGVSISIVHPAPVGRMVQEMEEKGRLFEEEIQSQAPGLIAMKAVRGMLRGDGLIIPGFWNRLQFFLNRQATSWFRDAEINLESGLDKALQPSA